MLKEKLPFVLINTLLLLKEKLPIFLINTLLLHIPLLALTDRQNDGQRNELILVGLGNLRFLQVCQFPQPQ
jgi:hypothetical protein